MPKKVGDIKLKQGISLLLVGEAGTGKTHLIGDMANGDEANPNVYVIDFDGGLATIRGKKGVVYDTFRNVPPGVPADPDNGLYANAGAWEAFDKTINDALRQIVAGTFPYTVIAIDSVTMMAEVCRQGILQKAGRAKMEIQDWSTFLLNMSGAMDRFANLPKVVKVATAHVERAENPLTKATELLPLMEGKFQGKLAAYFDEVFYAVVNAKPQGNSVVQEYVFKTAKQGLYAHARSRWTKNHSQLPNSWAAIEKALNEVY